MDEITDSLQSLIIKSQWIYPTFLRIAVPIKWLRWLTLIEYPRKEVKSKVRKWSLSLTKWKRFWNFPTSLHRMRANNYPVKWSCQEMRPTAWLGRLVGTGCVEVTSTDRGWDPESALPLSLLSQSRGNVTKSGTMSLSNAACLAVDLSANPGRKKNLFSMLNINQKTS